MYNKSAGLKYNKGNDKTELDNLPDNQDNTVLDIVWLRASILGAVWASVEIVLGSFLHSLKLPFAGTLLSAIAVFLLTSFDRKWQENGAIWKAGIIAAIMKSIAPSTVIFGPMIGIFTESVLFYFALRLFGRNIIGYASAGALAVSWSFIQKAVSLIISYGSDIIQLYMNLYKYASKAVVINNISPVALILAVFGIYCLIGVISAMAGYRTGSLVPDSYFTIESRSGRNIFFSGNDQSSPRKKTGIWLASEIILLVISLIVISYYPLFISIPFAAAILSLMIFRNSQLIRKILKIKFWIEISVIAVLAGLFLGKSDGGYGFISIDGLISGVRMILRALTVTACFSAIGFELADPVIRSFLFRNKLKTLSAALETSFEALPSLITNISEYRSKIMNPVQLVNEYIASADKWISVIIESHSGKNLGNG